MSNTDTGKQGSSKAADEEMSTFPLPAAAGAALPRCS